MNLNSFFLAPFSFVLTTSISSHTLPRIYRRPRLFSMTNNSNESVCPLMSEPSLTLLAISDLHYTGMARPQHNALQQRGELARILLRKVFLRLKHMGIKPDLTVLLGDLTEDGSDRQTTLDLISLNSELMNSGIPTLTLPGNHDLPSEVFNSFFACTPGLHELNGYGFVVFNDMYTENHGCTRSEEALTMTRKIAAEHPGLPLIALQHPPIYPAIDSHYPYRPENASEVISSYQNAGVFLSLSGHYHKGQRARIHEGVLYHTVPALCEAPFRFSLIHLKGKQVEIEELSLTNTISTLCDCHCHTEHAYCGTDVDTAACIALSQAMGTSRLCLTEHAFQLYFDKKEAMRFDWQSAPEKVHAVWETPQRNRMSAYRKFAESLRSPFVKIGLEVDLFDGGNLLLAPEDAEADWDLLVGAVHFIEGFTPGKTTQKEAEKLFIRDVEHLVEHNIQILAHPFRFFARNGLDKPSNLYPIVANLLADSGVAAEINFHTYRPDPEFIRQCAEKGVKIAFASDTHDLAEAGEFWPHIQLLKQAGISPQKYNETLFSI